MDALLNKLGKRQRKKAIEIFLLANNYHSIEGSDLECDDVSLILSQIQADWDKVNDKIVNNGWDSIGVYSVISISNAIKVSFYFLNKRSKVE